MVASRSLALPITQTTMITAAAVAARKRKNGARLKTHIHIPNWSPRQLSTFIHNKVRESN